MKSRTNQLWLLLILMVPLRAYAAYLQLPQATHAQHIAEPAPQSSAAWASPPFTDAQFDAFIAAALKAEKLSDPLQRCLAYPNPPERHWSDAVTSAYCHFKYDSWISRQDAFRLIRNGHADEVDKQLAVALHAQLAPPSMPGALDHTLFHDFADAAPDTRKVIETWKRQRPNSAFAWAASGMAYLMTADLFERVAPDGADNPAHYYLAKARTDLEHAVQLNPRITHAYASMIDVGQMQGDLVYAAHAAHLGLKIDPANFTLYSKLIMISEPEYGGSLQAVKSTVREALRHVDANPLLHLLTAYDYASNECLAHCEHCGPRFDNWVYATVFDHTAPYNLLMTGACGAQHRDRMRLAAIYHSETYRFYARDASQLEGRAYNLLSLGRMRWALDSADEAVRQTPNDPDAFDIRGDIRQGMKDFPQALSDYHEALRLRPGDPWATGGIHAIALKQHKQHGNADPKH